MAIISFVGTVGHAPRELREIMASVVSNFTTEKNISSHVGTAESWKDVMCDSNFSLCPRGYGRTSYRLAESIQLGRTPIFVFSDVLWVPYPHLYDRFGYATNVSNFQAVLNEVLQIGESELQAEDSWRVSRECFRTRVLWNRSLSSSSVGMQRVT